MPDPIRDPLTFSVVEATQVGEVRRAVAAFVGGLGFPEARGAEASIVATELSSNLARHARGGEVVIRSLHDGTRAGIELLSIDRGPGIPNVGDALRDGFSTGGTAGTGLGAARRLASRFDLFTGTKGTVVVAQLWADGPRGEDCDVGVVCLPKRGEVASGDAWAVRDTGGGRTVAIVADGLGHGLRAADASRLAIRLFDEHVHHEPARILELLHAGLRSTRGAAVSIAEMLRGRQVVRFAGVGNVSGMIAERDGKTRSMVSHNGTIGVEARRVQTFEYAWSPGALLLLHSDGLASQWQFSQYPGLRARHPAVIAGVLYRDHRRERDDVTVLSVGLCERGAA